MEDFFLHPPEAAKRKPTQFSERETLTDGENLQQQNEISLDAEKDFSGFAKSQIGDLPISLSEFQRARHVYISGRSGSSKSTLLERIAIDDINAGKPTLFFDPHGESFHRVLNALNRTRKVCVFDFADGDYAVRYNPIAGIPL